jgi:hypothetical protein
MSGLLIPKPNATVATHIRAFPRRNCRENEILRYMQTTTRLHGDLQTYFALSPTPRTGVHSTVVTNDATTDPCTIKLLGDDFSVLLSPYIDDNTPFAQAAFLDWQLLGTVGFFTLRFQYFV